MNSPRTFFLLLLALLVLCFGLGASLQPQFQALENSRRQSNDFFSLLLGDSSKMFANSFATKADAYYHSGYYPTIFDNNEAFKTLHMAEDTGAVNSQNHGEETSFMGPPRDWIDAFGRHFIPNRHTHLDEGGADDLGASDNVREILPWLKLSAKLDPENIQTYTVTAYWLRLRMHKDKEAEQVLREGLRNNPRSYEILFELGRLYNESYHDTDRARNVWELGVRYWSALDDDAKKENKFIFEQITTHLGKLEEDAGNLPQAVNWLQAAQKASMTPGDLQKRIDEIKKKMADQSQLLVPKPVY
jgi:tetratricopeptide (TPR) repeat protein